MTKGPVGVRDARERAAATYERSAARWATEGFAAPVFDIPLHPPTQGAALGDVTAVVAWARSWHEIEGVQWVERRWANAGDQRLPDRLTLQTAADIAAFAKVDAHWRTWSARCADLTGAWGDSVRDVVRRHAKAIMDLDPADHARLMAVVAWLVDHPSSDLYARQIPVAGVDTKWLASRRALVTALVTATTGADDLGLRQPPGLVRLRFLDDSLAPAGLRDLAAPATEIARLELRPRRIVVVENLETFLALPPLPGVVAVHGSGYAVDQLGAIGWIARADIVYWGDLDRDGFAILDRLRAHCAQVESVLMDEVTLLDHRDLWVPDPNHARRAAPTALPRLTAGERATELRLRELGGVRLEQERLSWSACLATLQARLA